MPSNSAAYSLTHSLDPAASVFVSANAGAGKTSLLTSRVLRLLLHGAPPSKILCLTFTNAAAAEMVSRVQAELGKWVMSSDAELREALAGLMEAVPDTKMLARARSLFATVLEAPEGMRIQTIHGFCQSLLRRFPIEAGVSPHFSVMDGRSEQELLQEARLRLFSRAQGHAELQESLQVMVRNVNESGFHALLGDIVQHKRKFRSLLSQPGGMDAAVDAVWRSLNLPGDTTPQSLLDRYFIYHEKTAAALRDIAGALLTGKGKSDVRTGQGLAAWFSNPGNRAAMMREYIQLFLNKNSSPRVVLFTKGTLADPPLIMQLLAEQERVAAFNNAVMALEAGQMSTHLLRIAGEFLANYDALKQSRALMDYDDLILMAQNLLQKSGMAQWVLFKLDGGIDHVLVDEAQDTSPEQWAIIKMLTDDFFSGAGRQQTERSLFVVGDEKQSIYSFQGADPTALSRMQRYFSAAINNAGLPVHRVALTHSFRSTGEVLSAVDAIFAQPAAKQGLMFDDAELAHTPTRLEHPGLVEVWPLVQDTDDGISAATQLARTIADAIRGWIDNGTAQAGDVMILVRSRTSLVDRMVRALKRRGVPVAGHDRMRLSDNLAVQDLIALGQCLLLPDDNLTLAALLKSPIFNISEEDLFQLAHGRGDKSVWERLSSSQSCASAFTLLTELRAMADFVSPYQLYSWLLDTQGARRRFIGRMGEEAHDPIDEFLNQALLYGRSHPPSLQGFLHWLNASDSEIKRDMEQAHGAVRIMTVHGAKGLQAPIIILPDTTEVPKMRDSILWHEGSSALPFWSVSNDAFCASLHENHKQAMLAEYRRLLYVALTRAEDRLYICGATNKDKIGEQSWYHLIKTGLAPLAEEFEMGQGMGLRIGSNPVRAQRDTESFTTDAVQTLRVSQDWSFLSKPSPSEPTPPKPLSPSHLADQEPAAASPLSAADTYQRGNFIHKLLQYLPDAPESNREPVARRIAAGYRQEMADECIREALAIINRPQFSFLFGEGSLAEAPVTGCVEVNGKMVAVSGQIDRLFIGQEDVWIVDYKSNREPLARIPGAYLKQMQLYRLLLKKIYPQKRLSCALLWTVAPRIQTIDNALLDEALSSSYI